MTTIFKSPLFGCCLAFLFLVATTANGANDNRFRNWVLPSGEKIEAQFQRIKGNNVILLNRAGNERTISLFALSAGDKTYVRLTSRGTEPDKNLDEGAKATPFVIDFSKGDKTYRHTVKYPGKVNTKNTVVEFTISGNGNREFPSSTRQKEPVVLGQTIFYEIRLARAPATKAESDLAADVEARMEYDSRTNEFVLHVEPYAKLIRGRMGADSIPLSVSKFKERAKAMEATIARLTDENKVLPAKITEARNLYLQAVRAFAGVAAAIHSKNLKTWEDTLQTNRSRIPANQAKHDYLVELAYELRDMESITVQYRIFSKVGSNLKLIVDGNSKD